MTTPRITLSRSAIASAALVAFVAISPAARAELTPWDQAKATALAKQLVPATQELYDSFYRQPVPPAASGQVKAYYRLKQKVRRLRTEARQFARDVQKGGGQVETQAAWEDLMLAVRDAREDAGKIFVGADVAAKAAVARDLLNQLGPYYDPNFKPLEPATR
jgi:hypothetical protein